ncbi:MAG: (2Fe-2S)-binding protein [Calditrichaeota bacterium]|nr:(2Fe-2S)-binding protein [Calditrichota bacterium]
MRIDFTLNGKPVSREIAPEMRLVDFLRNEMGLTGTKEGCGKGECGTCTVLLDGQPVCSCLMLCAQLPGHHVETIEGLQKDGKLHPLQEAFIEVGAVQCGFCTPGLVLSGIALLSENPNPSEAEIRRSIAGNLCRCTGYMKVVEAIRLGGQRLRENP